MITSLTVCVNYHDLCTITLPVLRSQVDHCVVVTSPQDVETRRLALKHHALVVVTDAFYRDGASFNKALALEEAVDAIEREGWNDWILHIDADVLVPNDMRHRLPELQEDTMYGSPRLMAYTKEDLDKQTLVDARDGEMAGWFQLFYGAGLTRPWYDVTWKHAGGYDSEFWQRFQRREWVPFKVIHLGKDGQNWHGRQTDFWGDCKLTGPFSQEDIISRRGKWLESKKTKRALDCKE